MGEQKGKWSTQWSESLSVVSDSLWPHGLYNYTVHGILQAKILEWVAVPFSTPDQNTGVGSCCLLQGIFQTQGLNPGLPHCRQILYQLSHQGSPELPRVPTYSVYCWDCWSTAGALGITSIASKPEAWNQFCLEIPRAHGPPALLGSQQMLLNSQQMLLKSTDIHTISLSTSEARSWRKNWTPSFLRALSSKKQTPGQNSMCMIVYCGKYLWSIKREGAGVDGVSLQTRRKAWHLWKKRKKRKKEGGFSRKNPKL